MSAMSRPLPPTITVRFGGWQRTFAPGADVVIGRDVRADVRLPHPAVSRAHVLLRYLDGRWVAIDNESKNGMFLGQRRVHSVDILNSETIHIGDPEGPRLTFELGPVPRRDDQPTTRMRQEADRRTDVSNIATTVLPAQPRDASGVEPPGSTTIGRAFGQRRRDPRCAGLGPSRDVGDDARGGADTGRRQRQWHVRQRPARQECGAEAERRRHDRQRRLRVRERQSRPSHRTRRQDRWPRGARRQLDHRRQSHTAGPCFVLRQAGHVDGGDRPVGFGQVHAC